MVKSIFQLQATNTDTIDFQPSNNTMTAYKKTVFQLAGTINLGKKRSWKAQNIIALNVITMSIKKMSLEPPEASGLKYLTFKTNILPQSPAQDAPIQKSIR